MIIEENSSKHSYKKDSVWEKIVYKRGEIAVKLQAQFNFFFFETKINSKRMYPSLLFPPR